MSEMLHIYRAQFSRALAIELQYRASLVIWLFSAVVEPSVYLVVWRTVAATSGGQVGEYTANDFAAYFMAVLLVQHLTFSWIMWEYEFRIREGLLSQALLRPIHPIHSDIADNLTYKALALSLLIPALGLMALVFQPRFNTSAWGLAAFVPALVLAFALRFLMEWTLALAAFWTTRISAINQVYFAVMMFMSGRFAPLSFLPGPVQALGNALPFRWVVSFPVETLLGQLSPRDVLLGYVVQAIWIALIVVTLRFVWRVAMRQYTGVGA